MQIEWVNWISVFMALIATASTIITYAVYRSSTDPEVIVYADTDKKRPSIIILIIENIGKGPAENISFKTSRSLPEKAFSIEEPRNMPNTMSTGPIINGIPFLAPNQKIILTWGQYGGLKKYIGGNSIVVTAQYGRANAKFWFNQLSSSSKLSVEAFYQTDISDLNWDRKISETLIKTNEQLQNIDKAIKKLGSEEI
ncbi:hypothetical protein IP510_04100 [Psychrobacter sp. NG254]|uniref:hypothetical protein n=1 Tax=Psychrobacter sp. NG254 TaxID=2782003 RepID=UPI001887A373|nr:hypothetical protein [Psychrobacter sp. NG254]MBF2719065.1 hypothetical protein [Psychrobacter sp. NG254]